MKEDVARLHGAALSPVQRRRSLPAAEYEVDPPVQPQTDVLALQGLPVAPDELPGVSASPRRQLDVADRLAGGLGTPEVNPGGVDEKLGQVVQLGDGFLDVPGVARAGSVGVGERLEEPIRLVKAPVLRCWKVRRGRISNIVVSGSTHCCLREREHHLYISGPVAQTCRNGNSVDGQQGNA